MATRCTRRLAASGFGLSLALFAGDAGAREEGDARPKPRAPTVEAGLTGMIGAAVWGNRASLTFGGPRLVVSYGRFSAGVSFFPSLVYATHTEREVRPMLGFGLELTVHRLALFAPYYYLGDRLRPLVGLGWKF